MKAAHRDGRFAVFDDVLAPDALAALWRHVRGQPFKRSAAEQWEKVWRVNDGTPMTGPGHLRSQAPFDSPLDHAVAAIVAALRECEDLVGKEGDIWEDFGFTTYVYPRGTRLSAHKDARYAGSCVFYVHPRWSPSWGGELFVPDVRDTGMVEVMTGDALLDARDDELLLERGIGTYVIPKPNRLVVLAPTTIHAMARVDPDAGEHLRCSLSVFVRRALLQIDA